MNTNEQVPGIPQRKYAFKKLITLGLGGTIGGPIFFILGTAMNIAASGLLISLLLNGILMICFVLIYLELALSLPIVGGGYSFSKEAIGGGMGFFIGWLIWIGNMMFVAFSCLGFALSFDIFFPSLDFSPNLIIITGLAILLVMYFLNSKKPFVLERLMRIFTACLVVAFLVYIIVGIWFGKINHKTAYSLENLDQPLDFLPIINAMTFTIVIFCLYEWNSAYESMTTLYDSIKQPRITIPRIFIFSIFCAVIIYWFVAFATLINAGSPGSETWLQITGSNAPLSTVMGLILGPVGFFFMGIAAIIATITSINAGIQMATHILYSMGRDKIMPPVVLKERGSIQLISLSFSCIISAVFIIVNDINLIAQLCNFIFLLSMIVLSLSLIILRKTRPKLNRPWKCPGYPYLPFLTLIVSVALLFSISDYAAVIGFLISLGGIIYYFFRITDRKRVYLVFAGLKIGCIILLIVFLIGFNSNAIIDTTRWDFLENLSPLFVPFIIISIIILILSTIFSLLPVRLLFLIFARKRSNQDVMGQLVILSERQDKYLRMIEFTHTIVLLTLSTLFACLALFAYLGYVFYPEAALISIFFIAIDDFFYLVVAIALAANAFFIFVQEVGFTKSIKEPLGSKN